MDDVWLFDNGDGDGDGTPSLPDLYGMVNIRATVIQILISVALGLGAFLAFCVLRPRWTGLYAARKKTKDEATHLPELPDTLFGWIVPLWKINDQQLLASAGLDAYVFLAFFKLAGKFLLVTLFFSLIVIKPVHDAYPDDDDDDDGGKHDKHGHNETTLLKAGLKRSIKMFEGNGGGWGNGTIPDFNFGNLETDYLWMYVVFAYLFSAIIIYLIISETRRVIEVRQEYMGTQTTRTDRTIRLSGIPKHLQDEDSIRKFIEDLDIGKVENVVLCRNWKELDKAMVSRMDTLRRLEEAYTIHLGYRRVERNGETLPIAQPSPPGPQGDGLASSTEASSLMGADGTHVRPYSKARPKATIRSGWFGWRRTRVDAIDYYEEKLRRADANVKTLRTKDFAPTPLAFVTLDSVAACQMAIQAVLDPSPLQLIANQSPEPSDVIWPNTYLTRRSRMIRSWSITTLIVFLTIFWAAIFVPIAGLLQPETIGKVLPGFAKFLKEHENINSLITTQLPILFTTLINVLVPYLYYWLSWCQGMISQGDIELSAISKNFFFTFFNFFVIFTVLGTASKFYQIFAQFGDALRDLQNVARALALSLQNLMPYYTNFIILQGVGLFPFRLLEVGSVSLYPVMLMGAKTPRDYAELVQPPIFSYGFYLPNALLIFIICMSYSVLRNSWQVLLAGFLYFFLGHFCYKYQLLYAMDHRQQTSGRAWGMICDRIFIGLVFFQLTTAGQLLLQKAFARSAMMIPLVIGTIWSSIVYGKTYKPLMKFIALSAVRRGEQYSDNYGGDNTPENSGEAGYAASLNSMNLAPERNIWAASSDGEVHVVPDPSARRRVRRDGNGEGGLGFVNPSLVAPLSGVWISGKGSRTGAIGMSPEAAEEGEASLVDVAEEDEDGGADAPVRDDGTTRRRKIDINGWLGSA